jgi:hypothetical protein
MPCGAEYFQWHVGYEADRRSEDDVRDGVVGCEEGRDEAFQEEETRDVKKGQDDLNDEGYTDAGTLMDRDLRLRL